MFFFVSFNVLAQLAVAIAKDSVPTIIHRIQEAQNWIDTTTNALTQIKHASDMVRTQTKAIEMLSDGDWESVVKAFEYEAQSLNSFTDFVNGMEFMKDLDIDSINAYLDSDKWEEFKDAAGQVSEAMSLSADAMWATADLVDNSEYRMTASRQINNLSQRTESVTGQLQMFNQQVSLLQAELSDIKQVGIAQNQFLATLVAEKDLEENEAAKKEKDFWQKYGSDYIPQYSEEDYRNALYGRRY